MGNQCRAREEGFLKFHTLRSALVLSKFRGPRAALPSEVMAFDWKADSLLRKDCFQDQLAYCDDVKPEEVGTRVEF